MDELSQRPLKVQPPRPGDGGSLSGLAISALVPTVRQAHKCASAWGNPPLELPDSTLYYIPSKLCVCGVLAMRQRLGLKEKALDSEFQALEEPPNKPMGNQETHPPSQVETRQTCNRFLQQIVGSGLRVVNNPPPPGPEEQRHRVTSPNSFSTSAEFGRRVRPLTKPNTSGSTG